MDDVENTEMDEQTLLSIVAAEEAGIDDTQLSIDRDRALDYYYGRANGLLAGPEIPNRSSYVSRDVADTIDWIMPSLMKTFLAGDDLVTFSPRSAEDVEAAEQETDYVNHVVSDLNPIYEIFSTWFDDALIQKNGYIYTYWKDEKDVEEEKYQGLTLDQITMLTQDTEVRIDEAVPNDTGMLDENQQPVMLYDVRLSRVNKRGRICIENIPPELVKVSWRQRSVRLQDSPFVGFDAYLTLSTLRESGFDVDDDISDVIPSGSSTEESSLAYRNRFSQSLNWQQPDSDDPASKVVRVRYRWMRVDFDGDGIAELRYLMIVGDTILTNDKTDIVPLAAITPRIVAHNHIGRSIEEVVADLQELKTQFIRAFLDNAVLANNGRFGVDENLVNLDDMMVSRPGGMVRVNGSPGAAIMPLTHSLLNSPALQVIEMVDGVRETRTGVTKYNMGQDAGNLNKTATGISIISSAANQRIEWIARTFAETGVKELFSIVHALTRKFQDKEAVVRLRNKWVTVDPREWKKRNDLTISVGLGSINRQQQAGGIMQLGELQKQAFQAGIVLPENVYNMAAEYTKSIGFKDPDKFFTHPDKIPPKEPQADPRIEKIKADAENNEANRAVEREKMGMEEEQAQFNRQLDTLGKVGEVSNLLGGTDGLGY